METDLDKQLQELDANLESDEKVGTSEIALFSNSIKDFDNIY